MMNKIDELTKLGRDNARKLEELAKSEGKNDEKKEEEQQGEVLNVCRNDEFGLPPQCTPSVMNSSLALSKIKRARKLEKVGKLKQALIEYKRAKQFFVNHKGIQKKIERLTLEIEAPAVRLQLSFDDTMSESVPAQPLIKKKKLKGKKKEILLDEPPPPTPSPSPPEDANGSDIDVRMADASNDNYSYSIDEERMLHVFNTYSVQILKSLNTIGPTKAKAITEKRPFKCVNDIRRVHGFHKLKGWTNLVEKNKAVFENISAA